MAFKVIVLIALAFILASLGKALYHLSKSDADDGGKMLRALTWRIGLSVLLFLFLILAYYQGWVRPN
jgi:hypothetical protein